MEFFSFFSRLLKVVKEKVPNFALFLGWKNFFIGERTNEKNRQCKRCSDLVSWLFQTSRPP